jgi:hypothetical protein
MWAEYIEGGYVCNVIDHRLLMHPLMVQVLGSDMVCREKLRRVKSRLRTLGR